MYLKNLSSTSSISKKSSTFVDDIKQLLVDNSWFNKTAYASTPYVDSSYIHYY